MRDRTVFGSDHGKELVRKANLALDAYCVELVQGIDDDEPDALADDINPLKLVWKVPAGPERKRMSDAVASLMIASNFQK